MIGSSSDDHTHRDHRNAELTSVRMGACLQRAYGEMLERPVIVVSFSTVVGATLIYSITGPLGIEDTLSMGQRLLYVALCAVICWPLCHSLSTTILYLTRHREPHRILLAAITGAAFMAIPCSAVAYTIVEIAGQIVAAEFSEIYLNIAVALAACSTVVHYTACLRARLRYATQTATAAGCPMNRHLSSVDAADSPHAPDRGEGSRVPDEPDSTSRSADSPYPPITGGPATTAKPSRLLSRLPDNLGHDVIYLNVSGHYVNAVTTVGAGVILMRFADAIAELDDMGMQVHRSYWVAHRHITAIFRRDERTLVRVTGGHEIPVSRTYLAAVRAFMPNVARVQDIGSGASSSTTDSPSQTELDSREG